MVKNKQADLLNRLYCSEKDAGRKYGKHLFSWATKSALAGRSSESLRLLYTLK